MWKRMKDPGVFTLTVLSMLITWPICWLLVVKLGVRADWIYGTSVDESRSFFFFYMLSNVLIATIGAPFLAIWNIAKSNGA